MRATSLIVQARRLWRNFSQSCSWSGVVKPSHTRIDGTLAYPRGVCGNGLSLWVSIDTEGGLSREIRFIMVSSGHGIFLTLVMTAFKVLESP